MGAPGVESQYKELDAQIESLMKCSPLPETDVKTLCDKAREILQVSTLTQTTSQARSLPAVLFPYSQYLTSRGDGSLDMCKSF